MAAVAVEPSFGYCSIAMRVLPARIDTVLATDDREVFLRGSHASIACRRPSALSMGFDRRFDRAFLNADCGFGVWTLVGVRLPFTLILHDVVAVPADVVATHHTCPASAFLKPMISNVEVSRSSMMR